jgi:hypothetical protein
MRVVFVGPSLPDAADHADADIVLRPPARQGDLMAALADGATAVGLIDGYFEMVAPVWHKEILYLLSRGVSVLGAASMGALRAAECAPFGMIGIGQIFQEYASGLRVDDADVALLHGPQELGYPALTVPTVNIDATLAKAEMLGLLSSAESARLKTESDGLFYKQRTWKALAAKAGMPWSRMEALLTLARVDQKRQDAVQLLAAMATARPVSAVPPDWTFNATPLWRKLYPNTA